MHVLKVLRAVSYDATKRMVTAVHTYTSSPGKIMFVNFRIRPINEDRLSTKLDTDQTLGQKGSKKTQCKMFAGQRTLIPHFFSLGPETKTTFCHSV